MILKPNIEVTSSIRYTYENFLSFDSLDRAYIYAQIYDFSFFSYVTKFCELLNAHKNLRTQNLRIETGVRQNNSTYNSVQLHKIIFIWVQQKMNWN